MRVTAGTVIDVEYTVTNLGCAPTPTGGSRWQDAVYLSLDNKLGGDILLGRLDNGWVLDIGQAYRSAAVFTLPQGVAGNVFILVQADDRRQVDEFPDDGNNTFAIPLSVDAVPVPPPDLVVSSVAGPTEAFDGASINVRFKVENLGAGRTRPNSWSEQIWLTHDVTRPSAARGDIRLTSFGNTRPLDVGEFYERTVTARLPDQLSGQYFLTVGTVSG